MWFSFEVNGVTLYFKSGAKSQKGLVLGASTSATTHALVLSANVRRNEWLWQILDIGNVFGSTFSFKIPSFFNVRNEITENFANAKKLHRLVLLQICCMIS